MSRRVLSAVTVAVLVLAGCLTGCSAAKWGIRTGDTGRVDLTYALWDAYQQEGYQKSIDRFERLHPNIHVTIEQIPYNSYQQKVTAQYVSGNAPDVFWVNTPFMGDWAVGGLLTDVAPLVKRDGVDLGQYYPQLVRLHQQGDRLYGLPKDWDTIGLYYNRDYFAKVGVRPDEHLTWDPDGGGTLLPYLKRLTTDVHGRNAASPRFDPAHVKTYALATPNDTQAMYANYFAMNGGSIIPRPYARRASIDSPQNRRTLAFLTRTLQAAHVVAPPGESGPNADGSQNQTMFARGRIAMWQTGDWNTNSLAQLSGFKLGVLPLPAGPKGRISVFNGLTDGISSRTRHPREAWELVKWLGSADSQRILGSGGYVWPAIPSLDPLFARYWQRTKGIDVTPFLDMAKGRTVLFPVSPGIGEGLQNTTSALAPTFLGTRSPAAGLGAAQTVLDHRLSARP